MYSQVHHKLFNKIEHDKLILNLNKINQKKTSLNEKFHLHDFYNKIFEFIKKTHPTSNLVHTNHPTTQKNSNLLNSFYIRPKAEYNKTIMNIILHRLKVKKNPRKWYKDIPTYTCLLSFLTTHTKKIPRKIKNIWLADRQTVEKVNTESK